MKEDDDQTAQQGSRATMYSTNRLITATMRQARRQSQMVCSIARDVCLKHGKESRKTAILKSYIN